MPENKYEKTGIKVLHVIEDLLFLSKTKKADDGDGSKEPVKSPDDIRNSILLKIERAEIMSAMLAMREGKDKDI